MGKIIESEQQLYSFEVELKKEVEEEKKKTSKRKNKETGKMETITSTEKIKVEKDVPYQVIIKKPSRIELEDGDMFYSLQLNKFIKMGMLTKAMLSKQYDDQGGVWSKEERNEYAELVKDVQMTQIEVQKYSVLLDDKKITSKQKARLEKAVQSLAEYKRDLAEFELLRNSVFDHTADVKARNKTILWYILHLAYFMEEGDEDNEFELMFQGKTFEDKYNSYEILEDSNEELYAASIDRLSSIMSIWYVGGGQSQNDFEDALNEMKKTLGEESTEEESVDGEKSS